MTQHPRRWLTPLLVVAFAPAPLLADDPVPKGEVTKYTFEGSKG